MATARERLEQLAWNMRQRQEQESQAESLWKRALPRCLTIARSLVEVVQQQGVKLQVEVKDEVLYIGFACRDAMASEGAECIFGFNPRGGTMEGWRKPFHLPDEKVQAEHFFSLTVKLPAELRHVNEIGPSPIEQRLTVDTQEAFEKAVVDFLEWAMVKEGCAGIPLRLP